MLCWMFPGQPMKRDPLLFAGAEGMEMAGLCREATGFDPSLEVGDGKLPTEQVRLQVHGTAVSLLKARQRRNNGEAPDIIACHSMGIYAALAAAGAVSEHEALELTARAGTIMAGMAEETNYAFGCLVGLSLESLQAVVAQHGVYIANYNTAKHYLIAGERGAVMASLEAASAAGAFSASLFDCDAPLHTPLMSAKRDELEKLFAGYRYTEPVVPLVEPLGQTRLTAPEISRFLLEELLAPVWWERTYRALQAAGVHSLVEIGVGEALKKFNRWIDTVP